jgi:hypothetical protein
MPDNCDFGMFCNLNSCFAHLVLAFQNGKSTKKQNNVLKMHKQLLDKKKADT